MKKLLSLAIICILVGSSVLAAPDPDFLYVSNIIANYILQINFADFGLHSNGFDTNEDLNAIFVSFQVQDYSYDQLADVKTNAPELYERMMEPYLILTNGFYEICTKDVSDAIHLVFNVITNDGLCFFMSIDNVDISWMLFDS